MRRTLLILILGALACLNADGPVAGAVRAVLPMLLLTPLVQPETTESFPLEGESEEEIVAIGRARDARQHDVQRAVLLPGVALYAPHRASVPRAKYFLPRPSPSDRSLVPLRC